VEICHCGHPFKVGLGDEHATATSIEFMLVLQTLLQDDGPASTAESPTSVSCFLRRMSLPGALTLVNAFGIQKHTHQIIQTSQRTKSLRTQDWEVIVQRAWLRLEIFCNDPHDETLLGAVDSVLIMHLLSKSNHPVDHQVAMLACATLPRDMQPKVRSHSYQRTLF